MGAVMSAVAALLHYPFDPASRAARLALGEARVEFSETAVKPWEPDCILGQINPTGMPPVVRTLIGTRTLTLCELGAILGWIEDSARGPLLMPVDPAERAETRRLTGWFERRFNDEVNAVLLHERMEKAILKLGPPDARNLREGREALRDHLGQLEALLKERDWLTGQRMTQADLIAAAHLSVLDYFGEMPWPSFPALKAWYVPIKSRPAFRPLLGDRFPGVAPPIHYTDLDF